MFTKDHNLIEKKSKELKELKRKNRRHNGLILLVAFQLTSLVLSYYLGRSSHKEKQQ